MFVQLLVALVNNFQFIFINVHTQNFQANIATWITRNNISKLGEPQPTSTKLECSYKEATSNFGWKDLE
jgi:hypothetical protein